MHRPILANLPTLAMLLFTLPVLAQAEGAAPSADDPAAAAESPAEPALAEALARFEPVSGGVALRDEARLALPDGWAFLPEEHGREFLRELGNQVDDDVIGIAVPADFTESGTFAVYSYAEEGWVDDAETPDYDALLVDMKAGSRAQSEQRKQAGLGGVELLGWAEPPHYDKAQHKLYWATKLRFDDEDGLTLNYNVRILGRQGFLVVQGVGGIEQLTEVAAMSKSLLAATEFVEGRRYENYDPAYDKIAAYGIGGLIAGKIAAKVGLFAKFAIWLKVLWKPIAVGVVAIGAFLWKLVGGRKREAAAAAD
ncbi:MAG: DUF2167 domain-containing protein [Planctomycetes bacterium]|nr:DUF2167 domain-containing protein [Planctomycetota bacterium]